MCVCVYMCICVCVHVCTCVYMCTCACICVYYVFVCVYVYVYIVHVYVFMCVRERGLCRWSRQGPKHNQVALKSSLPMCVHTAHTPAPLGAARGGAGGRLEEGNRSITHPHPLSYLRPPD